MSKVALIIDNSAGMPQEDIDRLNVAKVIPIAFAESTAKTICAIPNKISRIIVKDKIAFFTVSINTCSFFTSFFILSWLVYTNFF